MKVIHTAPFTLLVLGLLLLSGSISFDASTAQAAPEDDIAAVFDDLVTAINGGDFEGMAALFTDEGLEVQFGTDRENAAEALAGVIGEAGMIINSSITEITVDESGEAATAVVAIEFDSGFSFTEIWHFELVDGTWLIGPNEILSLPIPEGVTAVPLELDEYTFSFDKAAVASGNVAFEVANVGEEEHEVALLKLDTDAPIGDVAESILGTEEEEDLPEGVEFAGFGGFFQPGQAANFVPEGPLTEGRYAFVCFLPAPDDTPHIALGMIEEFTVGSVSPPSTGDAGLLDGTEDKLGWTFLGLGGIGVALLVTATLKQRGANS